ncbi:MAG: hypothetical protein LBB85_01690 [Dysgonamonadaceae bacterium]|jgi:hypothetical protein|nr:hypothetical protein [Dysgonamonadaceae bacterium]
MKTDDLLDTTEVPAGLESRLGILIDRLAEEEKRSAAKTRQLRRWISGIAAGVTLLLGAGIFLYSGSSKDTVLTAQTTALSEEQILACREAQKALALVSRNFNKGMEQWSLAVNEIEKSNHTINKTFKR